MQRPRHSHSPDVSRGGSEDLPEARGRRVQREKPALGSLGAPPTSSWGLAPTLLGKEAGAPTLGGCPPVQLHSQNCPHLEPPPPLEDPSHSPSAGVTCNRRSLPLQLPKNREGIVLSSPIPRASLPLVPAESSPCLCSGSARHQPSTHVGTSSPEGLLRSKTPLPAFLCPHLGPLYQILSPGCPIPHSEAEEVGWQESGAG